MKRIEVIGIGFGGLGETIAKALALSSREAANILAHLVDKDGDVGATFIATENACELLLIDSEHGELVAPWLLDRLRLPEGKVHLSTRSYHLTGADALRHVFRQASLGWDTRVDPSELARISGATSPNLTKVLDFATRTAHRVRRAAGDGVHLPAAPQLVALAARHHALGQADDRMPRTLILGAGKPAHDILSAYREVGREPVFISDPDPRAAHAIAARFACTVVPWPSVEMELLLADCLIDTVGANLRSLGADELPRFGAQRHRGKLLVLNAATEPGARTRGVEVVSFMDLPQYFGPEHLEQAIDDCRTDVVERGIETWFIENPDASAFIDVPEHLVAMGDGESPSADSSAVVSDADIHSLALRSARGLLHDCASWLGEVDFEILPPPRRE